MDFLAFDIGASNGRGIIGRFDGSTITPTTVHHFENNFIVRDGIACWDYQNILSNLKIAFQKARQQGFDPACFGIDTWGVDFGLLNQKGELIKDPRAYRAATDAEMNAAWEKISKKRLFELTGIAAMNFNTVYQLYRRVQENDPELREAETLLMMPDLLGYSLTGEKRSEYTIASTTNLLDVGTRNWSKEILDALAIPEKIFTPLDMPGELRGRLSASLAQELGVSRAAFAAVGAHDTASAVAAIPGEGDFAFCSSGTWSLFGMETAQPVMTDYVYDNNFSNEGTVQGGFRPLKNIMGLWIIQECRRDWAKQGQEYSWDAIVKKAREATPFQCVLDPDHPDFFLAGDMPEKIRAYCKRTGQHQPQTVGEIARCVYESLALKYRWAVTRLGEMRGQPLSTLNIVGGGIQNELLNQMAADSTGLYTTVGPIEGAALGNTLMQAIAMGEIKDLKEARQVVRASVQTRVYEPRHDAAWDAAYQKMLRNMED